ncbi:hypothetical protein BV210_12535 [Halorientalis sp. IM1011]|uniref:DUF7537 family lipoprotein n=1 Tax=Halorientalis sp. IM1011 TaxID=1932360 RepID=UPI00097CCF45|nr:hypothetical protein [Halorientalis sp. IM1011]AQL43467.1 hypothetical protein BV210_12535 [Halorientalis sp. IM1011]
MYRHCVLALVLVLAGCSGLAGDPTATPDPTGDDESNDGGDAVDGPTVPGVAADGSVNESALLNAHFETLDGNASRQHYLTRSNGTVDSNTTTVRNESHLLDRSRGSFPSTTYQSTDRTWSVEHERWGEERYTFSYDRTGVVSSAGSIDFGVAVYIGSGQFERDGTTTYRGDRVVRLEADDAKSSGMAGAYDRYDVTLLVDERGLIRRATGTVTAGDEPPTSFDITSTTDVERVPRPSWAENVLRGRTAMAANDTAVELQVTGGPTLPANTTVEFSIELREHTVRTDRPIEPGDTVYLSLKPGEYEPTATLTRSPPDPDTRLSIGDEVSQATIRLEDPPGLDAPMEAFFRAGPDPFESVGEGGETERAD